MNEKQKPTLSRVKLTDTLVAGAENTEPKREYTLWDKEVSGFGLRVRETTKTYVVMYRPLGAGRLANSKRLKIGTPETLSSVKEARRLALVTLGQIASGADPAVERKAERDRLAEEKRREDATVEKLLDRYELRQIRKKYVNTKTLLSLLRRRLLPFAKRDIESIKGWEYATLLEKISESETDAAAAEFRTRCNMFLNWCATEARVLDANPLAGYRRGRGTRAERVEREQVGRALSDIELARVWHAADPATSFGRLIRFLILTGCRRNEGAKLLRSMVDDRARRIVMPNSFTKQAREHTLYIADALQDVLACCAVDARNPDLLFPSPRSGKPFQGWSQLMAAGKRSAGGQRPVKPGLAEAAEVDFTLHDLRRTFRTGLSRLGVDKDTAELALGHAREDLESRYNRDDCEAALRAAFESWGTHVERIMSAAALMDSTG